MHAILIGSAAGVGWIGISYAMEPLFPMGDWRWLILSVVAFGVAGWAWRRNARLRRAVHVADDGEVAVEGPPRKAGRARFNPVPPIIGGILLGLVALPFVIDALSPSYRWTHPTLSDSEQRRAIAECRERAIEATATIKSWQRKDAKSRYTRSCLFARGFTMKRIDDAR